MEHKHGGSVRTLVLTSLFDVVSGQQEENNKNGFFFLFNKGLLKLLFL